MTTATESTQAPRGALTGYRTPGLLSSLQSLHSVSLTAVYLQVSNFSDLQSEIIPGDFLKKTGFYVANRLQVFSPWTHAPCTHHSGLTLSVLI